MSDIPQTPRSVVYLRNNVFVWQNVCITCYKYDCVGSYQPEMNYLNVLSSWSVVWLLPSRSSGHVRTDAARGEQALPSNIIWSQSCLNNAWRSIHCGFVSEASLLCAHIKYSHQLLHRLKKIYVLGFLWSLGRTDYSLDTGTAVVWAKNKDRHVGFDTCLAFCIFYGSFLLLFFLNHHKVSKYVNNASALVSLNVVFNIEESHF